MKTFNLFFGVVFICLMNGVPVAAQVEVDASGKIIFGNKPLNFGIIIRDDATSSSPNPFTIYRNAGGAVYLTRNTSLTSTPYQGIVMSSNGEQVMVGSNIPSNSSINSALQVYGSNSGAIFASFGVYGYDAIRCDAGGGVYPFAAYNSSGQKKFYVDSDGNVFSATNHYTSDISLKKNIEPISNSLEKVMLLRGVTFDSTVTDAEESDWLDDEKKYEQLKAAIPEITPEIFRQIQEEKSRKKMGVIAQEVEKIIPEVVRTREDGLKTVAYAELVGLLIEAIKEQQAKIERLESSVFPQNLRSDLSKEETSSLAPDETTTGCQLFQNAPNPFSVNTEIRYFLTVGIANASLYIYDMQGKQIKSIPVMQRGEGAVQIQGSELSAGMYIYTLIADNKVVDTKRMILTE